MRKNQNKIIGKSLKILLTLAILLNTALPAHARLLFTQDELDETYRLDTDKVMAVDDAAGLEFESQSAGNIIFDLQSTGDFVVQDAGSPAFIVEDSGEVGVGLSNPSAPFHVAKSTAIGNDMVYLNNPTGGGGGTALHVEVQSGNSDEAVFIENKGTNDSLRVYDQASDTTPFVVSSGGQVGVMTASPLYALEVGGMVAVNGYAAVKESGGVISFGDVDGGGSSLVELMGDLGGKVTVNSNVNIQPDNDTDDYIYFDTTSNEEYMYFEDASLAYTNDPGFRLNSTSGELEYRDEDEAGWTSFDSLSSASLTLDQAYTNGQNIDVDAAGNLVFNLTNTEDFVVQDNGTPFMTFNDDSTLDYNYSGSSLSGAFTGIDLDLSHSSVAAAANTVGLNLNYASSSAVDGSKTALKITNTTAGTTGVGDLLKGQEINIGAIDNNGDVRGLEIIQPSTIGAFGSHVDDYIRLTKSGGTLNGSFINISGGAAADTGLNLGATDIVGTTSDINLTNFDVTGSTGDIVTAGGITANGNAVLGSDAADDVTVNGEIQGASPFILEGATDNGFETTLAVTDPTADNTITFQDGSGTVAFTSDIVASGWTDDGTLVRLDTATDNVTVGSATDLSSKLAVDGNADEIQFTIQGNATQNADLMVAEDSAGTDLFNISSTGNLTMQGKQMIDTTDAEAFLVRKDGDGGDIFTVDTTNADVEFGGDIVWKLDSSEDIGTATARSRVIYSDRLNLSLNGLANDASSYFRINQTSGGFGTPSRGIHIDTDVTTGILGGPAYGLDVYTKNLSGLPFAGTQNTWGGLIIGQSDANSSGGKGASVRGVEGRATLNDANYATGVSAGYGVRGQITSGSSVTTAHGVYGQVASGVTSDTAYGGYFTADGADTASIGLHAEGTTRAAEFGPTPGAVIFNDGDTVLGGTTMAGTERLRVIGGDVYSEDNLYVGSNSETISNPAFTMNGNDAFIADSLGVEGNVYTDGSFIAGASLSLSDSAISDSNGDINIQPDNDTDDYMYFDTTTNTSHLFWSGTGVVTNDPGLRVNTATQELEYRDEDEAGWTSFDSLSSASLTLDQAYTNGQNIDVDAAGNLVFNLTNTEDFVVQDAGTPFFTLADTGVITYAAPTTSGRMILDATSTDSTLGAVGVLDINVDSGTNTNVGATIDYESLLTNTVGNEQQAAMLIFPTQGSTGVGGTHTLYGMYVYNLATSGTPSGTNVEYGVRVGTGYDWAGYFESDSVVGPAANGDLLVGGTSETLANTGFTLGGDDLFVAGTAGVEGQIYTDATATKYLNLDIDGAVSTSVVTGTKIGGLLPTQELDPDGDSRIIWSFPVPDDWESGTDITATLFWSPSNTDTGNVAWDVDYATIPDGDTVTAGDFTSINSTEAAGGTTDQMQTETFTIANAGIAADEMVVLSVNRDGANVADTFTGNVHLSGVRIAYTGKKLQ